MNVSIIRIGLCVAGLFFTGGTGLWGRDLYVNPETGDDTANGLAASVSSAGRPVRSIARGIRLASAGDTVHLAQGIYKGRREQVGFYNKAGEPGKPIVLDGHGATIDGCEPLDPERWSCVAPGLYRSDTLHRDCFHANEEYVARAYFLFDGRMNRMGRSLKGPKAPYKTPEALQPGEWTYQADTHAFFVKTALEQALEAARIEVPWVTTGIQIAGDCHDIIIRNVRAARVLNDGYGIAVGSVPGSIVRRVRFENIEAFECGDDGLSAHGDCEIFVEGFLSQRNGTGICTCGRSWNNRVVIREAHGLDLDIYAGCGPQVFSNSLIVCHGIRPVTVSAGKDTNTVCTLVLDNVLVRGLSNGVARTGIVRVSARTRLEARRCTFSDLSFTVWPGAGLKLRECVVAGRGRQLIHILTNAVWQAERNLYDLEQIHVGGRSYRARFSAEYGRTGCQDNLSEWKRLEAGQEQNSEKPISIGGVSVGADLRHVPGLGIGGTGYTSRD